MQGFTFVFRAEGFQAIYWGSGEGLEDAEAEVSGYCATDFGAMADRVSEACFEVRLGSLDAVREAGRLLSDGSCDWSATLAAFFALEPEGGRVVVIETDEPPRPENDPNAVG